MIDLRSPSTLDTASVTLVKRSPKIDRDDQRDSGLTYLAIGCRTRRTSFAEVTLFKPHIVRACCSGATHAHIV